MAKKLDIDQLRSLSPLDELKSDALRAILDKVEVLNANRGQTLFKTGDKIKRTIYLLSGTIALKEGDEFVRTITGGTDEARSPIDPVIPRQRTAVADGDIEYISIDSDFLDVTVTWDQTGIYEVADISTDTLQETGDWMAAFLNIKAFQKIPPANIQTIFMRLQQVNYKAGDVVIRQGTEGDYFYVINEGRCRVTRETPLKNQGIDLAELHVGDTFGEEALLAETKCNATITMQTDGALMRLGKDDFKALLEEPMLEWVTAEESDRIIADGGQWLDVRLPAEFNASHKDGALNLPLYLLRHKLSVLDPDTKYIACCDTGRRSSAAAFVLMQKGYQAAVLRGGLNQAEPEELQLE
jgi:CRP-like cAMP-binding protein